MKKFLPKNRYTLLGLLFFFLLCVLFFRLFTLQVFWGPEYRARSERIATRFLPMKAPRGLIMDCNGEILAGNRLSYHVEVFQNELLKGEPNQILLKTAEVIERNGDKLLNSFPIKYAAGARRREERFFFDWGVTAQDREEQRMKENREYKKWAELYRLPPDITASQAVRELRARYKIPDSFTDAETLTVLVIWDEIKKVGFRAYQPVAIAKDIKNATLASLEELGTELPGIAVTPSYIREYPHQALASHVLGYIGKITQEEWERNKEEFIENNYDPAVDLIGRWEMEKVLEPYLHGKDGGQRVEVDVQGRSLRILEEIEPTQGNSVYLTIDAGIQEVAEEALADTMKRIRAGEFGEAHPRANVGSVVVLDVNSGAVLALANIPSFDPNFSVTGQIDYDVWKVLNPTYEDPNNPGQESRDPTLPRPLVNNAVRGVFPPGSIFKMLVAAAGFGEGVVTPETIIVDRGRYTKYSEVNAPACWIWNEYRTTHGPEDVIAAIRDSCNYYFYEVGDRLGIDKIEKYARRFGLGEPTGIELPNEAAGIVAGKTHTNLILQQVIKARLANLAGKKWSETDEKERQLYEQTAKNFLDHTNLRYIQDELGTLKLKNDRETAYELFYRYIIENDWNPGKTLSASIGQSDNTYSPLQIAGYIAALANGGTRYKVHLIDKILSINGDIIMQKRPEVLEQISINSKDLHAIRLGMRAVTSNTYEDVQGTAARYFRGLPIAVAGKTGSAQFRNHDAFGWFASFAPYDNPQIAVIVMIAEAGSGGYTAPVAAAIYTEYFGLNTTREKIPVPNSFER